MIESIWLQIIGFILLLPLSRNSVTKLVYGGIPSKPFSNRDLFVSNVVAMYPHKDNPEKIGIGMQSLGIVLIIIGLVMQFSWIK